MSQIEEKLGSFSENPTRYRKEFLRLSQAYNLTWSDTYFILNATLTPDEKDHIWQVAKAHANHLYNQDWDSPVADEVVPQLDPHWTYQPSDPGIRRLNHMITCLLERMKKNIHVISMSIMIKSEKSPKGQKKIQPHFWHASQRQSSILRYHHHFRITLPSCSIHQSVLP